MSRARASVVGLRTDKGENSENPGGCKFRKHDDAMRMMTWQDATRKQMTKQQQRNTGGQLAHQVRGVTKEYQETKFGDSPWHPKLILIKNQATKLGDASEGIPS